MNADQTAFIQDTTRTRQVAEGTCPVAPAPDESVDACVAGISRSQGNRRTAVVASTRSGSRAVTVYDETPAGWQSTLIVEDPSLDLRSLRLAPWQGFDDAIIVTFPFQIEVVTTDAPEGSRVAGTLRTGQEGLDTLFMAHRILARLDADPLSVAVLAPPQGSGNLDGTMITADQDGQRLAEDVALRVYKAWVTANRDAAQDYVTAEVDRALFEETPAAADSFEMVGTTCPVEGDAYVCRFQRGDAVSTWELRPVDGVLEVVALR